MKYLFSIFCLLLFVACKPQKETPSTSNPTSTAPTAQSYGTSQKTISKYLTKFEDEYHYYTSNTISTASLTVSVSSSLNGTANIGSCSGVTILLQSNFWNSTTTTNSQREQLIFHELGHCLLSISGHNDSMVATIDQSRSINSSIMSTNAISDSVYRINRNYYLQKLFNVSVTEQPLSSGTTTFPESYYAN